VRRWAHYYEAWERVAPILDGAPAQEISIAAKLEMAILQSLGDDQKTSPLFTTSADSVDSLAGELAGDQLLCGYDKFATDNLAIPWPVLGKSDTVSISPAGAQFSQNGKGDHVTVGTQPRCRCWPYGSSSPVICMEYVTRAWVVDPAPIRSAKRTPCPICSIEERGKKWKSLRGGSQLGKRLNWSGFTRFTSGAYLDRARSRVKSLPVSGL